MTKRQNVWIARGVKSCDTRCQNNFIVFMLELFSKFSDVYEKKRNQRQKERIDANWPAEYGMPMVVIDIVTIKKWGSRMKLSSGMKDL